MIGCKWVFKIKRDGRFRARLVALGYSQIPGVDFTDNFSPVVNDTTLRIVITRMLVESMRGKVIDVETAFLYGELEHEIYMRMPEGYKEAVEEPEKDECLLLERAIYGLVQAARQFWKKFTRAINNIGFEVSKADPCLLYREDNFGVCMIILYIDDMLIVGSDEAIEDAVNGIKKFFNITEAVDLHDYLGINIVRSDDERKIWMGQPTIIKSLEDKFGELANKGKDTLTPGTPGYVGTKAKDESLLIDDKGQELFRSGVGTLLYLTKHSRPDITNSVRELSKTMGCATKCQLKEMIRVIKYVLKTRELGLKVNPIYKTTKWFLKALSDSDFANDADTRISVYGFIVYFMGVPVSWKSKGMRSVVLSTTEAEYVAVSEVVKEISFIIQLLQTINIEVELPVKVHVDNIGAIWLANNQNTSERTKHVDIRTHFVREFIVNEMIDIVFVKSEDNDSDIFNKNLRGELHNKHSQKMVWTVKEMNES
jgi:hypothetical protein